MTKEQKEALELVRGGIADHGHTVEVYGTRIVVSEDGDPMRKLGEVRGPSYAQAFLEGVLAGLDLAKETGHD